MKDLCDFPGCITWSATMYIGIQTCTAHMKLLETPSDQRNDKQWDEIRAAQLNARARKMVEGRKK